MLGTQPIGLICIEQSTEVFDDETTVYFHLKFIFLKKEFRNKGHSKYLLEASYDFITTSATQIAANTKQPVRLQVPVTIYSTEGGVAADKLKARIEKWINEEAPENITHPPSIDELLSASNDNDNDNDIEDILLSLSTITIKKESTQDQ